MIKHKKKIYAVVLSVFAAVLSFGIVTVSAVSTPPYQSYYYDSWDNALAAPAGYIPVKSSGVTAFGAQKSGVINDLVSDDTGRLYVLDSDNSIIYRLDNDLKPLDSITLYQNGEKVNFVGAGGITVCRIDGELRLYIADTNNKRIILSDENGKVLKYYLRPETDLIGEKQEFSPVKIAVNEKGNMFVLCQTMFDGAVMMDDDGKFLGFFGSNEVEVDASLLNDYFWKNLLGESFRGKFSRYVPREYTNMALDEQGFMYTTTLITTDSAIQIRRLNWKSDNIIESESFGDSDNKYGANKFIDIVCMGDGMFATLDSNRGRVFIYGNDGEDLIVFGGMGTNDGTFKTPVAIETINDMIYVYDQSTKNITKFIPTEYGEKLLKANRMFLIGEYEQSNGLWNEILSENNGCEKAYISIGRNLMEKQEYDEALSYFKKSNAKEDYSDAYGQVRSVKARKYFPVYAVVFIALIVFILYALRNKGSYKKENEKEPDTFRKKFSYTLFHPDKGCEMLISKTKAMNIAMPIIVFLTFIVFVMQYQFTGYIFNNNELGKMNIGAIFIAVFGVFFIFVFANWLVTTMTDGKGKLIEIANVVAFCLIPALCAMVINIVLSNFLVLEEEMFMQVISILGILWSGVLLFIQLTRIHEFTVPKSILMCLLTLVAVVIILMLLLLCFSIEQQIEIFITSVVDEIKMLL